MILLNILYCLNLQSSLFLIEFGLTSWTLRIVWRLNVFRDPISEGRDPSINTRKCGIRTSYGQTNLLKKEYFKTERNKKFTNPIPS